MLSKHGRNWVAAPVSYVVVWLREFNITPNAVTYAGFALTVATAIVLGVGYLRIGGLVLLLAVLFDLLDGALARATAQTSTFGAFLDSTLDRYSESVVILALAFHYTRTPGAHTTEIVLMFLTVIGSLMVSYTRARAESLHIECKEGFLQRPERVALLIAGLLFNVILPVLWILAVFTNFTAVQRIVQVYHRIQDNELGPRAARQKAPAAQDKQTISQ